MTKAKKAKIPAKVPADAPPSEKSINQEAHHWSHLRSTNSMSTKPDTVHSCDER